MLPALAVVGPALMQGSDPAVSMLDLAMVVAVSMAQLVLGWWREAAGRGELHVSGLHCDGLCYPVAAVQYPCSTMLCKLERYSVACSNCQRHLILLQVSRAVSVARKKGIARLELSLNMLL
jgi:hypothetical protein